MRNWTWLLLALLWVGSPRTALAVYGYAEKIQPIATVTLDAKPIQIGFIYPESHFLFIPLFQGKGRLVAFEGDRYIELDPEMLGVVEKELGGPLARRVPLWLRIRLLNWWFPAFFVAILGMAYWRRKKVLAGEIVPGAVGDLSHIFRPDRYVNSPKNITTVPCPVFIVRPWSFGLMCLFFLLLCGGLTLMGDPKVFGLLWMLGWVFALMLVISCSRISAFRFDEGVVHFHGRCLGLTDAWSEPYDAFVSLTLDQVSAGKNEIYSIKLVHSDPQKTLVMLQKNNSAAGLAEELHRLSLLLKLEPAGPF